MQNQIQIGSVVKHEKFERGIVTHIRTKTKRKVMQMARNYVPEIRNGMESMARTTVAEVSTDRGLWTVPLNQLTVIEDFLATNQAALRAAQLKAEEIKHAPKVRKHENLNKSYDSGFYDLREGDPIEVQFRDAGWMPAKFIKINSGGNITYERHGRQRHSAPQFVRVKE